MSSQGLLELESGLASYEKVNPIRRRYRLDCVESHVEARERERDMARAELRASVEVGSDFSARSRRSAPLSGTIVMMK